MAQETIGNINSIGLSDGKLGIVTDIGGKSLSIQCSEPQRVKLFPSLHIGDKIKVFVKEDMSISGGVNVLEKAIVPEGVKTFPTKQEKVIEKEISKQQEIAWQVCMKAAVEIEKLFVGNAEDRDEVCKNVLKMTNNLYEGTMRKFNGLPPFPEAGE